MYRNPYPVAPRRRFLTWVLWALVVGFVAVLVLLVVLSATDAFGSRLGLPRLFWGSWLFFLIFPIMWLSLFVARLLLWRRSGFSPGRRWDPALATARERYARGEITRDEYQRLVADLTQGRSRP